MVPAVFVLLPALPLGSNGKVDRPALAAVEISRLETGAKLVAPRTPLEKEVARVWTEVLGIERIGVDDSFWMLGGHSLLATRVLARLEDAFGMELPLQLLFTAPTLGRFAAAVGETMLAENGTELGDTLAELDALTDEEIRALLDEEAAGELEEIA
jgi:acyl carrier protein